MVASGGAPAAQDDRLFGLWRNWDHDPTLLAGLHWNLCRVPPGDGGDGIMVGTDGTDGSM